MNMTRGSLSSVSTRGPRTEPSHPDEHLQPADCAYDGIIRFEGPAPVLRINRIDGRLRHQVIDVDQTQNRR